MVEQAHREQHPQLEVSTYHLAQRIKSGYEGLTIALPPEYWPCPSDDDNPRELIQLLLRLARRIPAKQVATSKRGPKIDKAKGYVEGKIARSHVSTDCLMLISATSPVAGSRGMSRRTCRTAADESGSMRRATNGAASVLWHPSIVVLQTHDVVLSQISTRLNFNNL